MLTRSQLASIPVKLGRKIYDLGAQIYLVGTTKVLKISPLMDIRTPSVITKVQNEVPAMVVRVLDHGEIQGQQRAHGRARYVWVLMERLRPAKVSMSQIRRLQTALANEGYDHTDLQPQNVMQGRNGELKVIDLESLVTKHH